MQKQIRVFYIFIIFALEKLSKFQRYMDKIHSINDGVSLRVLFIFASFSYALKQCKITQNILNDNMFNEYIDYDDVYTGRFIKYPSQLAAAVESCQNIHLQY